MKLLRPIAALVLLGTVVGGGYWWFASRDSGPAAFQGYIEGNLVFMAPEDGGRIDRLAHDSGDLVAEGDLLFTLESSMQQAARNEAEARQRQAEAQLADLKMALQRPEQIAVLKAQEERARAALDYSRSDLERQQALYQRGYSAKARVEQAESAFERDKAALAEAVRQIEAAQLPGRSAEIIAAEAALRAAEASLRQAETRLVKRRVVAPAAARVQDVFYRPGEVVNAGQPVLALLPPGNLRVRFYVPEPVLSTVGVGQEVGVRCDSCGADLRGRISFISRDAEYTPPVIFSEQERAKLVFRAEARFPNGEVRLPIGLPVSVVPLEPVATAAR